MPEDDVKKSWDEFVEGLRRAGDLMDEYTKDLGPVERADGFRAITRMLAANLEKLEGDRLRPEVVRDNTANHKWFMDNPDGVYFSVTVDPGESYLLTGELGEAVHTSITAYKGAGAWHDTGSSSAITDEELAVDEVGRFALTISPKRPAAGDWLELKPGAKLVWIRQFFDDVGNERHGGFTVENLNPAAAPPIIEPGKFGHRLSLLGKMTAQIVNLTLMEAKREAGRGSYARVWEEMQGGAVYTSSDIAYMRGAWSLAADEALVLEGELVEATHWNVVLYSRYLNSIEHRWRRASLTGKRIVAGPDGGYRIVIAAEDPGVPNWLDTEGRSFGMFAIRWLLPMTAPELPLARVVKLDELKGV